MRDLRWGRRHHVLLPLLLHLTSHEKSLLLFRLDLTLVVGAHLQNVFEFETFCRTHVARSSGGFPHCQRCLLKKNHTLFYKKKGTREAREMNRNTSHTIKVTFWRHCQLAKTPDCLSIQHHLQPGQHLSSLRILFSAAGGGSIFPQQTSQLSTVFVENKHARTQAHF